VAPPTRASRALRSACQPSSFRRLPFRTSFKKSGRRTRLPIDDERRVCPCFALSAKLIRFSQFLLLALLPLPVPVERVERYLRIDTAGCSFDNKGDGTVSLRMTTLGEDEEDPCIWNRLRDLGLDVSAYLEDDSDAARSKIFRVDFES
jgi:hypothetical protein